MSVERITKETKQTQKALIYQADLHTRTVQTWLSSRSPNAVCIDGLGVKASSTGLPVPLLNLALSKRYPTGTSENEIVSEIEKIKKFFLGRKVPWYWWLGPYPKPSNMAEHLKNQGLVFDREPLPAMVAPLPAQIVAYSSEIQVWQASTKADLEAASTIRRKAFRFPEGSVLSYFEDMSDDWLASDSVRLYLACVKGGPPAAIGALIIRANLPGVYVMATLPEWKRQGLGKAILSRILIDAVNAGYPYIVLTASRFGYPLYQQFGFEEIFAYSLYYCP